MRFIVFLIIATVFLISCQNFEGVLINKENKEIVYASFYSFPHLDRYRKSYNEKDAYSNFYRKLSELNDGSYKIVFKTDYFEGINQESLLIDFYNNIPEYNGDNYVLFPESNDNTAFWKDFLYFKKNLFYYYPSPEGKNQGLTFDIEIKDPILHDFLYKMDSQIKVIKSSKISENIVCKSAFINNRPVLMLSSKIDIKNASPIQFIYILIKEYARHYEKFWYYFENNDSLEIESYSNLLINESFSDRTYDIIASNIILHNFDDPEFSIVMHNDAGYAIIYKVGAIYYTLSVINDNYSYLKERFDNINSMRDRGRIGIYDMPDDVKYKLKRYTDSMYFKNE